MDRNTRNARWWHGGDPVATAYFNALSAAFPQGETFFIESVRRYRDSVHAAAMKIEQLLETASRLFNERGLDGASLDQIAAALGATKGALYHYFSDKRELVLRCYERSADLDEKMTDLAERSGSTGLERGMSAFGVKRGEAEVKFFRCWEWCSASPDSARRS